MTRKGLVRKADDAFGMYIKARDGACVTCGRTDNLDCSHVIRKARGHFHRWNPDNAYAQCRTCHMEHHNVTELRLIAYATEKFGAEKLDQMRVETNTITKFKDYQLKEIVRYFTGKAYELNGRED
jgi:5-methylcytosine-specific restriction endonuclease McrA